MTDIFDEIGEDLRRERLKKVWDRFGGLIILIAIFIVLGTAGWRGYEAWKHARAASNGDELLNALRLAEENQLDQAIPQLESIIQNGEDGYPTLARFRLATAYAEQGDDDRAVTMFDEIADDASISDNLRDFARLRAGYQLLNINDREAIVARLNEMANGSGPFRFSAREIMGLSAFADSDWQEAQRWFERLALDFQAPDPVRSRAQLAISVIAPNLPKETVQGNQDASQAENTPQADAEGGATQ
jgi:hypothetical protein